MSATSVPTSIDLNLIFGALLVGTYISVGLFGIASLQTYVYYTNFPADRNFIKALVAWVWIFEFVQTIFITRAYYEISVVNFGSLENIIELPFVLKLALIWNTIVACSVQAFFAHRIRVISGRWEIAIICWILSALRFVASVITTAKEIEFTQQSDFNAQWKWIIVVVLSVGAGNDVLIAAGLSYYLSRSRSGIKSTDRMLNRLIKFTIQSGLLTSIVATAMLICYLAMPDNFIWLSLFVFLAKTYSNSFLATLNARKKLRSGLVHADHRRPDIAIDIEGSTYAEGRGSTTHHHTSGLSSMSQPESQPLPIVIEMTNVSTTTTDDDYAKEDRKPDRRLKKSPL